jgi:hypothetical protein
VDGEGRRGERGADMGGEEGGADMGEEGGKS